MTYLESLTESLIQRWGRGRRRGGGYGRRKPNFNAEKRIIKIGKWKDVILYICALDDSSQVTDDFIKENVVSVVEKNWKKILKMGKVFWFNNVKKNGWDATLSRYGIDSFEKFISELQPARIFLNFDRTSYVGFEMSIATDRLFEGLQHRELFVLFDKNGTIVNKELQLED